MHLRMIASRSCGIEGLNWRRSRRLLAYVLGRHRYRRVADERRSAGHHLVENDAERVDVAPRVDAEAFRLLWREVGGGSHHRTGLGQALIGVHGPCDPEVGDLHLTLVGDEDVSGLDVAVDHPMAVRVVERKSDIRGDLCGPVRVKRPCGSQDRRQRRPSMNSMTMK